MNNMVKEVKTVMQDFCKTCAKHYVGNDFAILPHIYIYIINYFSTASVSGGYLLPETLWATRCIPRKEKYCRSYMCKLIEKKFGNFCDLFTCACSRYMRNRVR